MAGERDFSPQEFGATFKGFLENMAAQAPEEASGFALRLAEHFGQDATKLPVVAEKFQRPDHPNLHLAIQSFLETAVTESQLIGVAQDHEYVPVNLARLVSPLKSGLMGGGAPTEGPVQYTNIPIGGDDVLACVQLGLYVVRSKEERYALLVSGPSEMHWRGEVRLEVMSTDRAKAEALLGKIRATMRRGNIYRGRVISLHLDDQRQIRVAFHQLPAVAREDIVLPSGLLERIERLTVNFARHSETLKAAGCHLKRGLLLFGPPGTGKTLTAMHLAGRMPERTVLLLTGGGLGLIEESCALARALQPATLILEDVDLVAEERTHQNKACNTVLFQLLNQMDGLADDADILFLLTTNRPDMLEPALAARPGRIDQALEVPLPDDAGRGRLLALYGRGFDLALEQEAKLLQRTEGVSAAFIRELVRKAALFAAEETSGGKLALRDRHFDEALRELVIYGGDLTKSLLGAQAMKSAE